jgi:protein SCO1/2
VRRFRFSIRRVTTSKWATPLAFALAAAVAAGIAGALLMRPGGATSTITGIKLDRPVPSIPLLDAQGHQLTLAAFRGKVVVVSPTLTLCHEVCPLTTGAFISMQQAAREGGVGGRVVFAEISVDPWRDSPARLRAFKRYTGIRLTLLTGIQQNLRRFWHFFGVGYFKTPQGKPPDIDWWTHRPETFDVAHSDGLFFIDQHQHLRIAILGMPNLRGRLAARLRRLLSSKGLRNLTHPDVAWTLPQALADLSVLLGRPLPQPR